MSIREDMRWLVDATECMVHGASPTWPREWDTVTGKLLGTYLRVLHQRWVDTTMKNGVQASEIARLKLDIDGLRATNEVLTDMVEGFRNAPRT